MDNTEQVHLDFETTKKKIIHPSLEKNRDRFPELIRMLTPEQEKSVGKIKNVLLDLPLLHRSTRDIPDTEPLKSSRIVGRVVATGTLDQSLGLDRFVYLSWGPIDYLRSRDRHYLIKGEILTQPNVVVTAEDITTYTFGGTHSAFVKLPKSQRDGIIGGYYGHMLRGTDWLELTSRRILANHENGEPLFKTHPPLYLGEVKVFGEVQPKYILGQAKTIESRADLTKRWFEKGFAVSGPNPETIEWMERTKSSAEQFWSNLIDR